MKAAKLIKLQNSPKKRIMAEAKAHAKRRLGIQAGDQDVTTKDFFESVCEYLEQLEVAVLYLQEQYGKTEQKS